MDFHTNFIIYFLIIPIIQSNNKDNCLNITLSPDVVLREDDLKNCYHLTNPTHNGGVQDVKISMNILDIDQINENNMEFRLHCYMAAVWKNKNINFTIASLERPVALPPLLSQCMWKPDIIFPNTKEIVAFQDSVPNVAYKYLVDGSIYRVERYFMRVSCPMLFSLYPLDTQHCIFKIALVLNSDELVKLHWYNRSDGKFGVFYKYKIEPLQFSIEDPIPHSITESWLTGNFTELWANITLHRRITGSVINFYIPSTLVVFLSWLSFYIDVQAAPARVTLGVTALLTITTQMVQARHILPPVQYITGLDIWLFVCLSVVFASFIEYSVAYSYRAELKRVEPALTQTPLNSKNIIEQTVNGKPWKNVAEKNLSTTAAPISCNTLDKYSRIVFPAFMVVFSIAYWSYYLRKSEIPFNR